jgi:hypothetical protein
VSYSPLSAFGGIQNVGELDVELNSERTGDEFKGILDDDDSSAMDDCSENEGRSRLCCISFVAEGDEASDVYIVTFSFSFSSASRDGRVCCCCCCSADRWDGQRREWGWYWIEGLGRLLIGGLLGEHGHDIGGK